MLQQNFMFGIQAQIKKNKEKTAAGLVEENSQVENEVADTVVEEAYNPGFQFAIYEMTEKAKKKKEDRRVLTTESFNMNRVQKKFETDFKYFGYLFENFVPDALKEEYQTILESTVETAIRLYQECDVTPRVMSPALNSTELSESQIIDLYKNGLNHTIKEDYTKPMLSGKIAELYESQLNKLAYKLIEENIEVKMDDIAIYLPFEESVYNFHKEVVLPTAARKRVEAFIESQGELVDLFENTAADILAELEKKIKLLTSLVSPEMFNAAVDSDVDGAKLTGITIISDENFDKDEPCVDDLCPAEIEGDEEAASELEDEIEAEEIHDEDGDEDDVLPLKDELDQEEEKELEDEVKDVQAVEDSDGTEEDLEKEADEDKEIEQELDSEADTEKEVEADEVEAPPAEAELPGEKSEAEDLGDTDTSEKSEDEPEFADDEVNSEEPEAGSDGDNDEDDELVEGKNK